MRATLLTLAVLPSFAMIGAAAPPDADTVSIATRRTIRSVALNEERTILVALPDGYERSGKSYPVLFLLDGEDGPAARAAGMIRYLSPTRFPQMIVVGIPNVDRGRDLSVVPLEQLPTSTPEGPGQFLRFLTTELLPFVDANYRTTRYRMLYGGSAGGQYAVYTMLNAPDAFDAFLTGGASLGIGGSLLIDQAAAFFGRQQVFRKFLSLVSFEHDILAATDYVPPLIRIFERHRVPGFRWHVKSAPGYGMCRQRACSTG